MNLTGALKTGRRIRRPHGMWFRSERTHTFSTEDVLCDTWEVEDTPIELTRAQYWGAVSRVLKKDPPDQQRFFSTPIFQEIADELGLV